MTESLVPASKAALSRRIFAADVGIAFVSPLAAVWMRDAPILAREDQSNLYVYALVTTAVSICFFIYFGIARALPRFFSFHDATQIAKASLASTAATSCFAFSLTRLEDIPRTVPLIQLILMASALIGVRLLRRVMTQRGERRFSINANHDLEKHIIIVGTGRLAWFYIRLLDAFEPENRKVVAILDDDKSMHGRSMHGHVIMGGLDEAGPLLDDFNQHGVSVAGFVICDADTTRGRACYERLAPLCRARNLSLEIAAERLGVVPKETAKDPSQEPYPTQGHKQARLDYFQIKQPVEAALAAVLLVLLLPVLALIGLVVAADMGFPVIFWQRRVGRDGRAFFVYKFRTMRNPVNKHGKPLTQDQRQTRVGRILRLTRLDELPQLYNIARGEMSIVGPRPLLPVDQPVGKSIRLRVPPGLTGWAQIHGGQSVRVEDKNALDEWYVRNASLWLDLSILIRTFSVFFTADRLNEDRLAKALKLSYRATPPQRWSTPRAYGRRTNVDKAEQGAVTQRPSVNKGRGFAEK